MVRRALSLRFAWGMARLAAKVATRMMAETSAYFMTTSSGGGWCSTCRSSSYHGSSTAVALDLYVQADGRVARSEPHPCFSSASWTRYREGPPPILESGPTY